ncbi:hypothetical protein OB236_20455 [Paenibacillus sp. WQ 127069]|uniref:Uncharacterized protein n=1 Tax=Paenibacillus baimaensis TaxID=2982185 RepID=A0ABT2ULE7_9BACL|nr:hypothetical protein [Paenibacillus sp. WQ 127069]MCU6794484.1 hypothetical protein [Paenibacillus sp. WQ 127069]
MDQHDIFTSHYRLLRRDQAARQRLISNPKAGLDEHFGLGTVPEGDFRIEIIPQEPDTIVILLPSPIKEDTSDEALNAACRRIYDILFTDGVGGYLIPDDSLTWVLRDMRSNVLDQRANGL